VDTKDDTDAAQSDIDPVLLLVDGRGNLLALADDDIDCSYPPVCGFFCPSIAAVACGRGENHSLVVRDFGAADITGLAKKEVVTTWSLRSSKPTETSYRNGTSNSAADRR
jgi:hypothetical protein